MTTVGSIGVGLLLLIIIWILALIIFVFGVRTQSNLGWLALVTATTLTVTLIAIPTSEKHKDNTDDVLITEKDYSYLYRTLLLSSLTVSVIVASVSFFVLHCIEPIRPKPIKT